MGVLSEIFTWWNGQTLGTRLFTARHGKFVGEDEADPKRGMISVTSPVARALMNKQVHDEVVVRVPKGDRELEILEIRFD